MEEKRSNGEISLTGNRKKVISSDVYTLKVPNFFTLPEYDNIDFELNSAPFEFADAIWRFRCKSREKEYREAGDGIKKFAVCLQRLDPEIPTNVVFYGIVLLDANDKEYDGCNNTYIFQKDYNEVILKNFEDSCPVFDRRNTLTLMIYLICVQRLALYPGEEGLITDNSQEPITSDKGNG